MKTDQFAKLFLKITFQSSVAFSSDFLPRFFLTFSGSTLVPTSGQLKSISPNVESKVQQMMRLAGVQQMGHLDGDSREITKD